VLSHLTWIGRTDPHLSSGQLCNCRIQRDEFSDAHWLANPTWNCAIPMTSGLLSDDVFSLPMAENLKTPGYWWHHLWAPFSQVRSGLEAGHNAQIWLAVL